MNRAAALRIVVEFASSRGGEEVRAAAEVLRASPRATRGPVSERGLAFADWFRSTLAAEARLAAHWREDWARCFDALVSIDERTPEQIAAVCRWARGHDFWQANFQTPLKLRQRKDGVMFFDRFAAAMQTGGKTPAKRVQPAGYKNAPGVGPVAVSASDILRGRKA